MTPSAPSACTQRRFQHDLIDRHFARRITPTGESSMRSHLPDCPSCRRYYERHMILAEVLPSRPRMADRLAVGLGLAQTIRPPKRRQWKGSWTLMTAGAAVACVAVLVARVGLRPADDDFVARGAPDVQARPQIEVYRVAADGSAGRPSDWMSPADELAFAYRNPLGFTRLMVFGIDDAQEIYWFHPAWTDPGEDPKAVPIRSGTGPFELPEAIGHDIRGSRLKIVALFTNEDLSVRSIEQAFNSGGPDPVGAVRAETVLEVRR